MLIYDFNSIGKKLLTIRKRLGLTQSEVAEAAGMSDRTYADIERGNVNMRIETILRICDALHITPDTILTEENTSLRSRKETILNWLETCSPHEQDTALKLLETYLSSIHQ